MKLPGLIELARGIAKFVRYEDGNLWYTINDFEFPVPISDAGGGVFLPEDKGIRFQRWSRKHVEFLKKSLEESKDGQ